MSWSPTTTPRPTPTFARLHEVAPRFPHLRVVHFDRNGGAGTAPWVGTQRARGEIVVWTDADMTYPNQRIPELVQLLDKDLSLDQVVGARTSEEGSQKICACPPNGSSASSPSG